MLKNAGRENSQMINLSAHNQSDRFFRLMVDYINQRSKKIFGNNEKYSGLLFTNLPYITMEFKKGSLKGNLILLFVFHFN